MASILETPHIDPVPPYAPRSGDIRARDSDTVSIVSLAPSYHSTATELPTYDSIRPLGLPRLRYAPGFTPATLDPFSPSNFTNSSSVQRTNPARRQYENVANRRVQHGEMMNSLMETLASMPTSLTTMPALSEETTEPMESVAQENERVEENEAQVELNTMISLPQGAGAQTAQRNRNMLLGYCPYIAPPTNSQSLLSSPPVSPGASNFNAANNLPANPHEDPELVGHAAAERARAQRLYREAIRRELTVQAVQRELEEAALLDDNLTGLFATGGNRQQREWDRYKSNIMKGGIPVLGRQIPFRRWSRS